VRPARRISEFLDFHIELLAECRAHALGDGARLYRIVIDMGMIAEVLDGVRGLLQRYRASSHSDAHKSMYPAKAVED
jgi:hypothetical protein